MTSGTENAANSAPQSEPRRWVEVLEFQRKSAVVWRPPFLVNDPPPFEIIKGHSTSKFSASYSLHLCCFFFPFIGSGHFFFLVVFVLELHMCDPLVKTGHAKKKRTLYDYQLPTNLTWDGEWSILIEPGKTDEEGWSYAVKFDSESFSIDGKHCYFVRSCKKKKGGEKGREKKKEERKKRKYVRDYKKGVPPTPNGNGNISITPAQGSNNNASANPNTPQVWFSVTEQPHHNVPTLTEHVVFEVETRDLMSRNWKPYNALWFNVDMKPLFSTLFFF
ncbi:hypothetical protein RFI_26844 [Reticulomyxa filosa]|uniref:Uncharacterized protein n=1 Tax=Reticulomyxa filosa TaxID=46433 RepID=X6M9H4_RETFI|nr:hypothetical protein RFI_26844 [Reticulomyxa filosa]|eukprot:ETO10534.1 hypothetical protein RFI_26844 [Reticulomyxa filosa]